MKAFRNIERKLSTGELRLVTDNEENDLKDRPTLIHVSRYLHLKEKTSKTACGKSNFKGQQWSFFKWMYENGPVCKACKVAIEKFGEFYG